MEGCAGRCQECQSAEVSCIRPKGGTASCKFCRERKSTCCEFSHQQDAESASRACDRCGSMIGPNRMPDHLRRCKGRCSECRKANVPCVWQGQKGCCDRCDTLQCECADFTHNNLAIVEFATCDRCQDTVNVSARLTPIYSTRRNNRASTAARCG